MFCFRLAMDPELSRRVLSVLDQVPPGLPGIQTAPLQTLLLVFPQGETVEYRDVQSSVGSDMPIFREVTPEQLALRNRIIDLLSPRPAFIPNWELLIAGAVRTPIGGFVVGAFFATEESQLAQTTHQRTMKEHNFFLQFVLDNCKAGLGYDELAQLAAMLGLEGTT